jgi:hypothetical protein
VIYSIEHGRIISKTEGEVKWKKELLSLQ